MRNDIVGQVFGFLSFTSRLPAPSNKPATCQIAPALQPFGQDGHFTNNTNQLLRQHQLLTFQG